MEYDREKVDEVVLALLWGVMRRHDTYSPQFGFVLSFRS